MSSEPGIPSKNIRTIPCWAWRDPGASGAPPPTALSCRERTVTATASGMTSGTGIATTSTPPAGMASIGSGRAWAWSITRGPGPTTSSFAGPGWTTCPRSSTLPGKRTPIDGTRWSISTSAPTFPGVPSGATGEPPLRTESIGPTLPGIPSCPIPVTWGIFSGIPTARPMWVIRNSTLRCGDIGAVRWPSALRLVSSTGPPPS